MSAFVYAHARLRGCLLGCKGDRELSKANERKRRGWKGTTAEQITTIHSPQMFGKLCPPPPLVNTSPRTPLRSHSARINHPPTPPPPSFTNSYFTVASRAKWGWNPSSLCGEISPVHTEQEKWAEPTRQSRGRTEILTRAQF